MFMPRRRIMQVRYFQLLLLHDPMAMLCYSYRSSTKRHFKQRWAKLLILVDFDVDIDNILEIDVEFDVWSDFDFGIEYCQANLQMLKLSTNLDMQLLNLEFES